MFTHQNKVNHVYYFFFYQFYIIDYIQSSCYYHIIIIIIILFLNIINLNISFIILYHFIQILDHIILKIYNSKRKYL